MVTTANTVLQDAPASELVLRICGSSRDGQVIRLRSPKCTIGSGPRCTVRLRATGVRPIHCLIVRGQRATVVRRWTLDTRLNGRAFTDAELAVGDRLSVGPIEFEVLDGNELPDREEGGRRKAEWEQRSNTCAALPYDSCPTPPASTPESAPEQPPADPCRAEQIAEDLARQRETIAQEQSRCQAERAELDAQRESWNRQREQWLAEQAEAEARLSTRRDEIDARAAQLDARAEELQTKARQLDVQTREFDAQAERLGDRARELDTQAERLGDRVREVDAQAQQLGDRVGELDAQAERLGNRAKDLDTQTERLDNRAKDLDAQAEQLGNRAKELDAQTEQLNRRSQELEAQAEELNELATRLDAEAEDLEAQRAELEAQLAMAELESEPDDAGQESEPPAPGGYPADRQTPSHPPAEIRFEEVSKDAPLSSEEVFRRLGTYPVLPEDQEGEPEPEESLPSPTPRGGQSSPRGGRSPDRAAFPAAFPAEKVSMETTDAEDGSIDQYMAQLLRRVRSVREEDEPSDLVAAMPAAVKPAARERREPEPDSQSPKPTAKRPLASEPDEPVEMSPRASAPEKMVDLSAMRELANFSAKQAIDCYSRRMLCRSVCGKLVVMTVSLLAGLALMGFWWNDAANRVALYAAVTSFAVALFWAVQHLVLTGRTRKEGGRRKGEGGGLKRKNGVME